MKRLFVVALIIGVCIFLYRCDQSSRPSQEQIEELIGFDDRDIGYSKDVSVDIVTDNFGVTLGGSSTPYHMILRVRWEPLWKYTLAIMDFSKGTFMAIQNLRPLKSTR